MLSQSVIKSFCCFVSNISHVVWLANMDFINLIVLSQEPVVSFIDSVHDSSIKVGIGCLGRRVSVLERILSLVYLA